MLRPRIRWSGLFRVSLYLAFVVAGLSFWFVRSAYAQAEDAVRRFGEGLAKELGPGVLGPAQGFQVNGQRVFVASRQTELSVREVLDRFDRSCASGSSEGKGRPSARAEFDATLERKALLETVVHHPGRLGVVRHETDEEGQLACLAAPDGRRGLSAVLQAVQEFTESGDLSRLGQMRYVTARKLGNGKTHVIAIWSEGKFLLDSLFPETGDAAGSDMDGVPRPPEAARELCATALDQPFGLRLYHSSHPVDEVLGFYDRELPKVGWSPLQKTAAGGLERKSYRAFTRAGRAVAIGVGSEPEGRSLVSLIDLGSVHHSSAPVD